MSSQDLDVMYVQNPALGTVLLWRFTCGYYSNENRPVPFPLLFVVLPIPKTIPLIMLCNYVLF